MLNWSGLTTRTRYPWRPRETRNVVVPTTVAGPNTASGYVVESATRQTCASPAGAQEICDVGRAAASSHSARSACRVVTAGAPLKPRIVAPISASLPIVNLLTRLAGPRTFARRGGDYVAIISRQATRVNEWRFQP